MRQRTSRAPATVAVGPVAGERAVRQRTFTAPTTVAAGRIVRERAVGRHPGSADHVDPATGLVIVVISGGLCVPIGDGEAGEYAGAHVDTTYGIRPIATTRSFCADDEGVIRSVHGTNRDVVGNDHAVHTGIAGGDPGSGVVGAVGHHHGAANRSDINCVLNIGGGGAPA